MTNLDYLRMKNRLVGITMDDSTIEDFLFTKGFLTNKEANTNEMDKVYLELIVVLLLKPDISEGDLSIKYDRASIIKWFNYEANRLGVDGFTDEDKTVQDMSHLA